MNDVVGQSTMHVEHHEAEQASEQANKGNALMSTTFAGRPWQPNLKANEGKVLWVVHDPDKAIWRGGQQITWGNCVYVLCYVTWHALMYMEEGMSKAIQ
jgi:hypothetical protein